MSQIAINTTVEHLSKLTIQAPQKSTEVAAIQKRINDITATREIQEQMNNLFAEVMINASYLNYRNTTLLTMKDCEKTCLELTLERLNKEMVKKELYLEERKF